MVKFIEHKGGGGASGAMQPIVELADRAALLEHIRKLAEPWPTFPPVTADAVHVLPCGPPACVFVVTLDGYGVLGYTDRPC